MLKAVAKRCDGTEVSLLSLETVVLRRDLDTPADIADITFSGEICEEIAEIKLTRGDTPVFTGIVDEQAAVYANKVSTRIIARSTAALLLDNEACPEVFTNPTLELIFNRYAKRCTLKNYQGGDIRLSGTLKVQKGTSCYQVIRDFCMEALGCVPYVEDRVLYPSGIPKGAEAVFSDTASGIPCTEIEVRQKRCELLSSIRTKSAAEYSYSTVISDKDALAKGVCRQRYADALGESATFTRPVQMIKNARSKSCCISLVCRGCHTGVLGADARVTVRGTEHTGYFVSSVTYTMKNRKEQTKVILQRRENQDVADIIYGKEY